MDTHETEVKNLDAKNDKVIRLDFWNRHMFLNRLAIQTGGYFIRLNFETANWPTPLLIDSSRKLTKSSLRE